MGSTKMRLALLLLLCLQCCLTVSQVNAYNAYPLQYQQQYRAIEQPLYPWRLVDDDGQVVKRRPNNYNFFLKGLRGKRSIASDSPSYYAV